ncbi:MAG: glycosyl hydrolase [Mangrovibacterium sp.]
MRRLIGYFFIFCCLCGAGVKSGYGQALRDTVINLETGFSAPPKEAKPHIWWHWVNGNVSKEGITKDLEAIRNVGIAGVTLINPGVGPSHGPVNFNSPEWWNLVYFAVKECERLGLDFSLANCAGWSESGGTWITPALSMQKVTWSETTVEGGRKINLKLKQPVTLENYYKDIAVYAFPTLKDDDINFTNRKPVVTSSFSSQNLEHLIDGKIETAVEIPVPTINNAQYILFEFKEPFPSRMFTVHAKAWGIPKGELQVSDDGLNFKTVCKLNARRGQSVATAYPEVKGKFYRLYLTEAPANGDNISFSEIELSNAWRLTDWKEKVGFASKLLPEPVREVFPPETIIDPEKLIDITSYMSKDGELNWNAPKGTWTILRMGHTSTGHKIGPAPVEAQGLECDKLNPEAVTLQFNSMAGKAAEKFGALTGKVYNTVFIDSWEAGNQNWTPKFVEEFTQRRGYSPLKYLPAITGRVIKNVDFTERFLWDIRRTIADLIAENHFGVFQKLSNQKGLKLQAQAPGVNVPTIFDPIQSKQYTDEPMGTFWVRKGVSGDGKETASVAHVYGKRIIAAEAFTAEGNASKWANYPYELKPLGDRNFIQGFNRFFFHRFVHQPDDTKVPGLSLGRFGIHFERTNTWWDQSKAWVEYITRCQFLLQQGLFVGDICYYYGEDAPNSFTKINGLPYGYDYDNCDKDALLKRFSVKNGLITLPDGMSYRLLVLPDKKDMSPEVITKLHELVKAGALVSGRKPLSAPGLRYLETGYSEDVKKKIEDLWGQMDGDKITGNSFGKGKVYWGKTISQILKERGINPDFKSQSESGEHELLYIHRKTSEADIYFISSQSQKTERFNCTFCVTGKSPELWDAASGKIIKPAIYTDSGSDISLPVELEPSGSMFIVFRSKNTLEPLQSITKEGTDLPVQKVDVQSGNRYRIETSEPGNYQLTTLSGKSKNVVIPAVPKLKVLDGPWNVKFPKGWGAPEEVVFDKLISWTTHADEGIRYFSGTASYQKQFHMEKASLGKDKIHYLHIDDVKYLAEVFVNGKNTGILWKAPYRLDITQALKEGLNHIEIKVTNLWPNRLIGDEKLSPNERYTFASYKYYKPDSPLPESGLLGQVAIQTNIVKIIDH